MKVKKFEYKTEQLGNVIPYPIPYHTTDTDIVLNTFGMDGWELCSVVATGTHSNFVLAFFKREIK